MMMQKLSKEMKHKLITFGVVLAVLAVVSGSCIYFLAKSEDNEIREFGQTTMAWVENPTVKALKQEKDYHAKNLERYLVYREENSDLSLSVVVRDVNVGLDKTPYEDAEEADTKMNYQMLVNKYHELPSDYAPEDMVTLSEKYSYGSYPKLRRVAARAFMRMVDAARLDGITLRSVAGYRDYAAQDKLYKANKDDEDVDRAGFSEHQTGLAVDINSLDEDFRLTPTFQWLREHAAEYGFVLRYPDGKEKVTGYEFRPWHYRYVGPEVAERMVEEGLTLEEFFARYMEKSESVTSDEKK